MAQIDELRTAVGSVAVPAVGYGSIYIPTAGNGPAAWKDDAGVSHLMAGASKVFDVTEYGLVANSTGVAGANVTAINLLLGTTAPAGSVIYFPPGVFYFNAAWATVANGFAFKGVYGATSIAMTAVLGGSGNWINCTHASQPYSFDGLMFFSSGVTQTAGYVLELNSTLQPIISNCQWNGGGSTFQMFSCIDFSGSNGGNGAVVMNCNFGQFKGVGINSTGDQGSMVIANCLMNGANADASFAAAGIQVSTVGGSGVNGGAVLIDSCDIIKCQNNLLVNAGTSTTIASVYAVNTFFDQSINSGVKFTGAGTNARHRLSNCYITVAAASSSANGIEISTTGSSTHAGIEINDCWILNTPAGGGSPVGINATAVADFVVSNCQISGWTTGISVTPVTPGGTTKPTIQGCAIGPVGIVGGNTTGITLATGSFNYGTVNIQGNNFTGTTTPINDLTFMQAGAQRIIFGNAGLAQGWAVATGDQAIAVTTITGITNVAMSLPANSLRVGTTLRFRIEVQSANVNPITPKMHLGTTGTTADAVIVNTVPSAVTPLAATGVTVEGVWTVRATGASAATRGQLFAIAGGSAVAAGQVVTSSAAVNVNTTVANIATLSLTQATAGSMTVTNAFIEVVQQ